MPHDRGGEMDYLEDTSTPSLPHVSGPSEVEDMEVRLRVKERSGVGRRVGWGVQRR